MKICKTCGLELELSEFAKGSIRCKDGVRGDCKKCHSKKSMEWQKLNSDRKKEYFKKWYSENQDKVKTQKENYKYIKNKARRDKYKEDEEYRKQRLEDAKNWQNNNPIKRKNQRLKTYGISYDYFISLLEKAENKCQICGYSDTSDKKMFPLVDHCHTSNEVRGILCLKCNMALGNFKDSIENLQNAIKYLKGDKNEN